MATNSKTNTQSTDTGNDFSFATIKRKLHATSNKAKANKAALKTALSDLKSEQRTLAIQLNDAETLLKQTLAPIAKQANDKEQAKAEFGQHALKVHITTMWQLGLSAKPIEAKAVEGDPVETKREHETGYQSYDGISAVKAMSMNVRTHMVFDSKEALYKHLDNLVGKSTTKTGDGFKSALTSGEVYGRTSTHVLKPGNPPKEGKDLLAGAKGWLKRTFLPADKEPVGNFGIDLAIGGLGNKNFLGEAIKANGQNGTMLLNITVNEKKGFYALSTSIEDSAPGKKNQFGKVHSNLGGASEFSATGITKKAPKKLKGADYFIATIKALPKLSQLLKIINGQYAKEHDEKSKKLAEEWQGQLNILPPEKRGGFMVGQVTQQGCHQVKIAEVDTIASKAKQFTLEQLRQAIKDIKNPQQDFRENISLVNSEIPIKDISELGIKKVAISVEEPGLSQQSAEDSQLLSQTDTESYDEGTDVILEDEPVLDLPLKTMPSKLADTREPMAQPSAIRPAEVMSEASLEQQISIKATLDKINPIYLNRYNKLTDQFTMVIPNLAKFHAIRDFLEQQGVKLQAQGTELLIPASSANIDRLEQIQPESYLKNKVSLRVDIDALLDDGEDVLKQATRATQQAKTSEPTPEQFDKDLAELRERLEENKRRDLVAP